MITSLISIGNSRGIRIPKPMLSESGLKDEVELKVKKGEIKIIAAPKKIKKVSETALMSEKAFARDWDRPEEDEAWAKFQ